MVRPLGGPQQGERPLQGGLRLAVVAQPALGPGEVGEDPDQVGLVRSAGLLVDGAGALPALEGLGRAAAQVVDRGEVGEDRRQPVVVRPEALLEEARRLLEQRLGPVHPTPAELEAGQVGQAGGEAFRVARVRTVQLDALAEELLGAVVVAELEVELAEGALELGAQPRLVGQVARDLLRPLLGSFPAP